MSKVTLNIELKPFMVPNYVLVKPRTGLKQDGISLNTINYHAHTNRLKENLLNIVLQVSKAGV